MNWKPKTSLSQGLSKTIDWYVNNKKVFFRYLEKSFYRKDWEKDDKKRHYFSWRQRYKNESAY